MSNSLFTSQRIFYTTLWVARLAALLAIIPVLLILVGESGNGPADAREWVYLLLFPIGFSSGYLLAWRWPVFGGCLSLACMAASLIVIGKVFPLGPYVIWGLLSVPGLLLVAAGLSLRFATTRRLSSG